MSKRRDELAIISSHRKLSDAELEEAKAAPNDFDRIRVLAQQEYKQGYNQGYKDAEEEFRNRCGVCFEPGTTRSCQCWNDE